MTLREKINVPRQRERQEPRISLNKLGEYLAEKNASRRTGIVADQKRPKDAVVPYYDLARDVAVSFLAGEISRDAVLDEMQRLFSAPEPRQWFKGRNLSCAYALEHFLSRFENVLEGDLIKVVPVEKTVSSVLLISGVRVSVRPDVLLFGIDRSGHDFVGAIKLHFPRAYPLNSESGQYVATVLHQYIEGTYAAEDVKASRSHCIVIDVFSGEKYVAPAAYKRRRKDIAAGCQQIAALWPRV